MKAKLPKGMGGGAPGNMQGMIRQAQKMQAEMERVGQELEEKDYTASSGGNAVTATVSGKLVFKSLEIKPEVVDPEDIEMLSDLVVAAVNEALRTAEKDRNDKMEAVSGGLNIPGLF